MEKKEDKKETKTSQTDSGADTNIVTGEEAEHKDAATVKTDEHSDQEANGAVTGSEHRKEEGEIKVVYKFRDFNKFMVKAWEEVFKEHCGEDGRVEVSVGDIFKGAPAADALVSPANSYGFMDGGIDMVYTRHFGWQMQHRLQEVIRKEHDGELLVGNAAIIPAYQEGQVDEEAKDEMYNEGQPIKYLISAPTMRVPMEVDGTPNSYLAFRAVLLAVQKHNRRTDVEPIRSILCPGLGTAVGQMPKGRCARQMLVAYETFVLGKCPERLKPQNLFHMVNDHDELCFSQE
ncbi:uncharacterized protein LOC110464710 isoform X2 [Mizuhopecten yessoensis]|uniref:Macro domain-containing protein n=2 Tax=Mizuhopecten yessoensis TaxID=6573 RepID=A0A210PT78_MIZYE|nr:uncharacterized protein LOC110464710 isoform X2 [Mizuhopecten yessoensis]OWF39700.1 hypothetical protein KP79_PYT07914 [Mizuhopecten yessoensis]